MDGEDHRPKFLNRRAITRSHTAFENMQDELDALLENEGGTQFTGTMLPMVLDYKIRTRNSSNDNQREVMDLLEVFDENLRGEQIPEQELMQPSPYSYVDPDEYLPATLTSAQAASSCGSFSHEEYASASVFEPPDELQDYENYESVDWGYSESEFLPVIPLLRPDTKSIKLSAGSRSFTPIKTPIVHSIREPKEEPSTQNAGDSVSESEPSQTLLPIDMSSTAQNVGDTTATDTDTPQDSPPDPCNKSWTSWVTGFFF